MSKVLLFGASGNIGKAIAAELKKRGCDLTVVVRSEQKAQDLREMASTSIIADVSNAASIRGICDGVDIVFSALGKSVSPNEKSNRLSAISITKPMQLFWSMHSGPV